MMIIMVMIMVMVVMMMMMMMMMMIYEGVYYIMSVKFSSEINMNVIFIGFRQIKRASHAVFRQPAHQT